MLAVRVYTRLMSANLPAESKTDVLFRQQKAVERRWTIE
jgi:hypothetical protein